jgi:hypothetical protein
VDTHVDESRLNLERQDKFFEDRSAAQGTLKALYVGAASLDLREIV